MPTQEQLNDKYKDNLSVGSTTVVKRDPNNNIILNNDNLTTKLVIEPVNWEYTNESINDVIETRFSYYTFPPRVTVVNKVNDDLTDVELPDVILDDQTQDKSFYVKYQPGSGELSMIDIRRANRWDYPINNGDKFYPAENDWYTTIDFTKVIHAIIENVTSNQSQIKGRLAHYGDAGRKRANMPARPSAYFDYANWGNAEPYIFTYVDKSNGKSYDTPYTISSILEERMQAITWGNLVDGNYTFDRDQSFVVTKEILELNKDLRFTIRLQLNHFDNLRERNTNFYNIFAFRLIKYSDNNSPSDKQLYDVLETVSTLTQGNIVGTATAQIAKEITILKSSESALRNQISTKQTELNTNTIKLNNLTSATDVALKEYAAAADEYNSIPSLLFVRKSNAKERLSFKLTQYSDLMIATQKQRIVVTKLTSDLTNLQNSLKTVLNNLELKQNFDNSNLTNLKYIFVSDNPGAYPDMSIFHMDYILTKENMKLGDRYDIEGLINYRDIEKENDPNSFWQKKFPKPGLDIRQSYWEIKAID